LLAPRHTGAKILPMILDRQVKRGSPDGTDLPDLKVELELDNKTPLVVIHIRFTQLGARV